jgi:hypothetical protein
MRFSLFVWMARLAQMTVAASLILIAGGPRSTAMTPIFAEPITIVSMPVALDSSDSQRVRVGALTLLSAWKLTSTSPQFGGWSGLDILGDRVTALGDFGSVLRFRLTRFGRAVDARIDPLPRECGRPSEKRDRDSESLARAPGGWWVGFEARNRVCRVTVDFSYGLAVRAASQMNRWPKSGGAEAMVALRDGRVLVFSERAPAGNVVRPLLVFDGDPTNAATAVDVRSYMPPDGYSPTDATQLPDGRILVLNRRFSGFERFTTILTAIDLDQIDGSGAIAGLPIARFAPPMLSDNFEGIGVTVENDRPIVWLISDDNFMSWQGSYLLKFALDPTTGRGVKPR